MDFKGNKNIGVVKQHLTLIVSKQHIIKM